MPILIVATMLVIAGLVARFAPISPLVGFSAGLGLGTIFITLIVRRLGKSARKSLIAWEVFSKLSSYKVPSYAIKRYASKEQNDRIDGEYRDIVNVLKGQMKFPPALAREAASYALSQNPDEPFEGKMMVALKYLGNGHKQPARRARG